MPTLKTTDFQLLKRRSKHILFCYSDVFPFLGQEIFIVNNVCFSIYRDFLGAKGWGLRRIGKSRYPLLWRSFAKPLSSSFRHNRYYRG